MELSKIKILIERYLNGETSLEEEAAIANYLATHDVPEELLPIKSMFSAYAVMGELKSPIETTIPINRTKPRSLRPRRVISVVSAACTFIAVIIVGLSTINQDKRDEVESMIVCHANGERVDDSTARAEVDRILSGVSNDIHIAMERINGIIRLSSID